MAEEDLRPDLQRVVRSLKEARGPCPPADTLVEYEALAPGERTAHAVHAHVQLCSRCQLVLLHLEEPAEEARRPRWLLPAAAAVLVAILSPLVYRSLSPDTEFETIRGTDIQPIAPAGEVSEVREFQWQSPIRAARFRVTVYRGSDGVWTSQVEAPPLVPAAPIPLEAGIMYVWQVEALDAEGQVRLTSPPQAFSIAR